MVSAENTAFELFLLKIDDEIAFLNLLNYNLPQDLEHYQLQVDKKFNIIHDSVERILVYLLTVKNVIRFVHQ